MKQIVVAFAIAASFASCVKSDNKYFTCHDESIFTGDIRYPDDSVIINPYTYVEYGTSTYSGDTLYDTYQRNGKTCTMRYWQICKEQ